MLHVLLTDFTIRRNGDLALRWPIDNLKRLAQQPVRVVFDDAAALQPVLRALCAHDVGPIELLDIDLQRWGFLEYDPRPVRDAMRLHGMRPQQPYLWWPLSRDSALWLIAELTTESSANAH